MVILSVIPPKQKAGKLYTPQKRSWTEAGELANLYEQMLLLTHVTTSKVSSKFINTKVII